MAQIISQGTGNCEFVNYLKSDTHRSERTNPKLIHTHMHLHTHSCTHTHTHIYIYIYIYPIIIIT